MVYENLAQCAKDICERYSANTLFKYQGQSLTFADAFARVSERAAALQKEGFAPGGAGQPSPCECADCGDTMRPHLEKGRHGMRKMRLHEAALIVALFVLPGAALAKGPKADQKPEPAKAAKVADEKGKPAKADEAKPDEEDGPARGKSDEAKAAGHGKSDEAKAADHGKSDEAKAAKEDGKADEAKDEKALKADGEGEASVEEQIAREDEKHRERLEKIARLEQIGQEKDNKTLVEKAAMLREKEARRHERKLEKINTRGHAAKDAKDADDHGKKVQR